MIVYFRQLNSEQLFVQIWKFSKAEEMFFFNLRLHGHPVFSKSVKRIIQNR